MTTVVVAGGDPPGDDIVAVLGAERANALAAELRRRVQAWVRLSFPEAAVRGCEGGVAEAVALLGDGGDAEAVTLLGEGGDAETGVFLGDGAGDLGAGARDPGGPVVIVAPELGAWRDGLASAALDDLRAGCALSFGPVFDGGLYLLALSPAALPLLRGASSLDLTGRAALAGLITWAGATSIEVGMLRTERGLRTPDDLRALLADPRCDASLRALLG